MAIPDNKIEEVSNTLRLLADSNRLDLLQQLSEPKITDEIELTPSRVSQGTNPDRQLTRQAVRHHLRQLRDEGLVETSLRRRQDGRLVNEFTINQAAFFSVMKELRDLNARICDDHGRPGSLLDSAGDAQEGWPPGPKLVLIRGLHHGEVYPLDQTTATPSRGWVIGRSSVCGIQLDHDPDVAHQNTEILPQDEGFHLIDLRSSHQGTVVNGVQLPFGGETDLSHGDILEIGSSVFVFHER